MKCCVSAKHPYPTQPTNPGSTDGAMTIRNSKTRPVLRFKKRETMARFTLCPRPTPVTTPMARASVRCSTLLLSRLCGGDITGGRKELSVDQLTTWEQRRSVLGEGGVGTLGVRSIWHKDKLNVKM